MMTKTPEQQRIEELEAQIAGMKQKKKTITFKVTPKGCVGIYGVRRMPISLYPQEIEMILDRLDDLKQFIKDNQTTLTYKEV